MGIDGVHMEHMEQFVIEPKPYTALLLLLLLVLSKTFSLFHPYPHSKYIFQYNMWTNHLYHCLRVDFLLIFSSHNRDVVKAVASAFNLPRQCAGTSMVKLSANSVSTI